MSKPKHVVTDLSGRVIRVEDMPDDIDVREHLRRAMHDCPDCRAAMERGEVPQFGTGAELEALATAMPRKPLFPRRPRWRDLKRRR